MTEKNIPLHEMASEDRIDSVRSILEEHKVPEKNWKLTSFLMGVGIEEAEKNGVNLDEAAGNVTSDVEVIAKMMQPMITRGFGQTAAAEICGVWPMKSDQGKIAYMTNHFTNDQANPVKSSDGQVLTLADSSAFTAGATISNSTASAIGTVRYVQSEAHTIFVELSSGSFGVGDSVDDASPYVAEESTVSVKYTTEIAQNVFSSYSEFATILAGENASTTIKEVELEVNLKSVEAENHKLRTRYSREFEARMRDYYGLDADGLTDSVMAMAFKQELNRRIFQEVLDASTSGGTSTWDYNVDSDGRWEEEKIKTLMTKLNFESADILQANFMEAGNYIVMDPITFSFCKSYGYIDMSMLEGNMAQPMKYPFVGILNGLFRVYVNPWLRSRTLSIGMKDFSGDPAAETRAGIFFNPYLAMDITKTIQDANGQPVKFAWSMYGFTAHPLAATSGTNDFFRRVNVSNLPNHA